MNLRVRRPGNNVQVRERVRYQTGVSSDSLNPKDEVIDRNKKNEYGEDKKLVSNQSETEVNQVSAQRA